jgi:hypothetical protein
VNKGALVDSDILMLGVTWHGFRVNVVAVPSIENEEVLISCSGGANAAFGLVSGHLASDRNFSKQ